MAIKLRTSRRNASIRRRYACLTSNEHVKLRKLKKAIKVALACQLMTEDPEETKIAEDVLMMLLRSTLIYVKILFDRLDILKQQSFKNIKNGSLSIFNIFETLLL